MTMQYIYISLRDIILPPLFTAHHGQPGRYTVGEKAASPPSCTPTEIDHTADEQANRGEQGISSAMPPVLRRILYPHRTSSRFLPCLAFCLLPMRRWPADHQTDVTPCLGPPALSVQRSVCHDVEASPPPSPSRRLTALFMKITALISYRSSLRYSHRVTFTSDEAARCMQGRAAPPFLAALLRVRRLKSSKMDFHWLLACGRRHRAQRTTRRETARFGCECG